MKIEEIVAFLEDIAPPAYQESYDNAGLIIGSMDQEVTGTLICLDSIEAVIEEAIERGSNLVIAHHPIVFKGLKKLNAKNYVERTIIKAIKHDIAIYAIHTNLDNVRGGVNEMIADKIGISKESRRILIPKQGRLLKLEVYVPISHVANVLTALWKAGAGQIGSYDQCSFRLNGKGTYRPLEGADPFAGMVGERSDADETKVELILPDALSGRIQKALREAHPYEEVAHQLIRLENSYQDIGSGIIGELNSPQATEVFLKELKSTMKAGVIKHTALVKKEIKKVAVIGGAGVFGLGAAKAAGADVFITGDVKYHEFFDAEEDIILVDIGHYESEQFTQELLQGLLAEKFPKFAHLLTRVNTNPVNYL